MKISNLNVAARLAMGFVTILVLLVLIGLLSLDRMRLMHTESTLTLEDRYPKITAITDIKNNLNQIARSMRNTLLLDDQSQIRAELAQIERDKQVIAERLASLEKQIANPKGRALLAAVQRARNSYYPYQEAFLRHVQAGELDQAKTLLLATLHQQQQLYFGTLDQLAAFQAGLMKEAGAAVAAAYFSSVSLLASLATLSIVLAGLIAWRIARSITVPLHLAVRMAQTVAAGDLTNQVVATGKDETGRLLHALMAMNGSLQTIVGEVRSGTDTIATASGQIASGNLDLSARTEQQASSLEQTASAMEELTGTVKQNADNARQANQLAGSARDVAVRGGQVVAQVVDTMRAINASSKKIADIVGVIDSIAFQTNILALNAAVEAARAGEQGRGFAVVATEVRNLAHRSAAAAKEIKGLIDASVDSVDAGTRLVGEAGATMQEIVDSVNRVTDVMSEITAASQEQTSGIEQINQAIAQMDEVTQQNAALVEESAAAAGALQDQAGTLLQVVSVFKLRPGHAPLARRPSLMVAAQ